MQECANVKKIGILFQTVLKSHTKRDWLTHVHLDVLDTASATMEHAIASTVTNNLQWTASAQLDATFATRTAQRGCACATMAGTVSTVTFR